MLKHFLIALLLTALVAVGSGCDSTLPEPTAPLPQVPRMMVVHAAPSSLPVTFSADAVTGANLTYLGVTTSLTFRGVPTNYFEFRPGSRNLFVRRTGAPNDTLIRATLPFVNESNTSLFVIDTTTSLGLVTLRSNDNLTRPADTVANVRFFHFSPNAPAVTVKVTPLRARDSVASGAQVDLFTNRSFDRDGFTPQEEAFTTVPTGLYAVQVVRADNGAVVINRIVVNLLPRAIYTIYARGVVGRTGVDSLSASLITNLPTL